MKKIMAVLCLLVICVTCIPVYGTLSNYDDTIPAVGNKTVATGSKTSDRDYYRNLVGTCEKEYIGWIEMKHNGDWIRITDEHTFKSTGTHKLFYIIGETEDGPAMGVELRFRIKKASITNVFAGQKVSGTINFE